MNKTPPVATGGPTRRENLPYPKVHYPPHYGAFVAFSRDGSSLDLCSCSRSVVKNFVRLRDRKDQPRYSDPLVMAPLSSKVFPREIAENSVESDRPAYEVPTYREAICHRCNLATPSLRYCHEMYGSKFMQRYGWYVRQARYRLGFDPPHYLESVCPTDLQELLDKQSALSKKRREIVDRGDLSDPRKSKIEKEVRSVSREISNYAENVVRTEFGHHEIGEKWTSETVLAQIVERILPNDEIVRHHRPDWLDGLELDIWVPKAGLAIEYQGQQHFHPIEAWGGEKALAKQKRRDERTRSLCKEKGVELLEIDFRDPLTEEFVRRTIVDTSVPIFDT